MHLGFVSTYLPRQCGIATYTDYLISGIRKIDPNLKITVLAEKGANPIESEKFKVISCWERTEDYTIPIFSSVVSFDLIHFQHEYSIYQFDDRLPFLLQKLKGKVKTVITIHCVRPAQFSERGAVDENYARKIAQQTDSVIVHLESQSSILERLGIEKEKIKIIPHGSEINDVSREEARRKLNLPKEGFILLSFGFIKPHKSLHIILAALKEIIAQGVNAYLFIAGTLAPQAKEKEREYLTFIAKRIEELNLKERVIFPNKFFLNEDVSYIFGAADLVLFPYYEEDRSASGSFHLAIGSKKPIIATRIPKFEELKNISDELLVLPNNAEAIAKIALRIFQDEKFFSYITIRTEAYRRKTAWTEVAKEHLQLYQSLIK